jgi:hypothetical protein
VSGCPTFNIVSKIAIYHDAITAGTPANKGVAEWLLEIGRRKATTGCFVSTSRKK